MAPQQDGKAANGEKALGAAAVTATEKSASNFKKKPSLSRAATNAVSLKCFMLSVYDFVTLLCDEGRLMTD